MFTALLDTSVLWPSLQRDVLLSLAIEGSYRAMWSSAILDELQEHEAEKLLRRGASPVEVAQRTARLIATMRNAFPEAEAQNWEPLEGTFGLPDPDDEHVVAAAVAARAGAIVTANLRDFPESKLPSGLEVVSPQEFVLSTVSVDPARAHRAVETIAERSGRRGAAWSASDVLMVLEARYGMGAAADVLRGAMLG